MWKSSSKKERGCAQVWRKVTTAGGLELLLTTPVRSRAFFMRRGLSTGARKVVTMTTALFDSEHAARIAAHAARVEAEFRSERNAKRMARADVCNVEPLTEDQAIEVLDAAESVPFK